MDHNGYKNNTVKTQRKADSAAVKEHFSQDANMCGFCDGITHIDNLLECMDLHATINALTALGAKINGKDGNYDITGITQPSKKPL